MRIRTVMLVAAAALLVCAVTAAMADRTERPRGGPGTLELTPEEEAFLDRVNDLRKQIEITSLELALLEAKEAPEGDIAAKAEQMYRLRGELYALRAKNRDMARKVWRHRLRDEGGRRLGWALGRARGGRGMGRGRGHGLGFGMGRGMGRHRGAGRGFGMGRGMGPGRHGAGFGRGHGMGQGQRWRMREPVWEDVYEVPETLEPEVELELEEELED